MTEKKQKMLYLFRGPCGCGKTTLREALIGRLFLPGLDMSDIDRGVDMAARVNMPADWLRRNRKAGVVWIEGVFAPGSPSLTKVLAEAEAQDRVVQHVVAFTGADEIRRRIGDDSGRCGLGVKYVGVFEMALE